MEIRLRYTKDHQTMLTWEELEIGSVFYNIHLKNIIGIKTSSKAYFCITDRTYHTRSKLLVDGGHKYKNYLQVNCDIRIYEDDEPTIKPEITDNKGDLISREALKETIIKICGKCSNNITEYDENNVPNGNCAIWHILNMIDNAPTVEPEPYKRGKEK